MLKRKILLFMIVLSGLALSCSSVQLPPQGCQTDKECSTGESCRVGTCNIKGECEYTIKPGTCYIDNTCYNDGDTAVHDLCKVCNPSVDQKAFSPKDCDGTCDPATGKCTQAQGDIVEDVGQDTGIADEGTGVKDIPEDKSSGADAEVMPDYTADTGQEKCQKDEDCAGRIDDLGPCEKAVCVNNTCQKTNKVVGSECTPEDVPEGLSEECIKGQCKADATCELVKLTGKDCDDGNKCTENDQCNDGVCVGTDKNCSDSNPCTKDSCNPDTGECEYDKLGAETSCDDNNQCTKGDHCEDGQCVGGENQCACQKDEDCQDDDNLCNGVPKCVTHDDGSKACEIDPETIVTCDTSSDTQCVKTECVPSTGECKPKTLVGQECDDNDKCTTNDICQADGSCSGKEKKCGNNDNDCLKGYCDADTGECKTKFLDGKECYDPNPCTEEKGICKKGACLSNPISCDDDNVCTKDWCDVEKGGCQHSPLTGNTCNDGNTCTGNDKCKEGKCMPGDLICECGPDKPCKDDGNLCNGVPKCVKQENGTQKCEIDPDSIVKCDTSNDTQCMKNTCIPSTGKCVMKAQTGASCDDSDVCTINTTCNSHGQCAGGKHVAGCCNKDNECNDGNLCTIDHCVDHKCTASKDEADFNTCKIDDKSGLCWYGSCMTPHKSDPIDVPGGYLCGGANTHAMLTTIVPYNRKLFAIGVNRHHNINMEEEGWILHCVDKKTYTDWARLFEISGLTAKLVSNSGKSGQSGNLNSDGSFPNTSMTHPLADISHNMVVGWKGAVGLIDTSQDPIKVNWDNDYKDKLNTTKNLYSVWYGHVGKGLFCSSSTSYYYIVGASNFASKCTWYKECSLLIGGKCNCKTPTISCSNKSVDFPVSSVAGYASCPDWYSGFCFSSSVSGVVTGGYSRSYEYLGEWTDSLSKITTSRTYSPVQDIVAVNDHTGMIIGSSQWYYYDLKEHKLTVVTPRIGKTTRFHKAFAYGSKVIVVADRTVTDSHLHFCSKFTDLYYVDLAKGWPGEDQVKIQTINSSSCSGDYGVAVTADNTKIYVVGGDDATKGYIYEMFPAIGKADPNPTTK